VLAEFISHDESQSQTSFVETVKYEADVNGTYVIPLNSQRMYPFTRENSYMQHKPVNCLREVDVQHPILPSPR
jgi:hypothetical protein